MLEWTRRTLPNSRIDVGPCAWDFSLALDAVAAAHMLEHPSLVVVDIDSPSFATGAPVLPPHTLGVLRQLRVALHWREPEFIRRLAAEVEAVLQKMERTHLDALILHVEEIADIKSGSALEVMSRLREQGKLRASGLDAPTALDAEWLAGVSSARLLSLPYSADDQLVRYRALAKLEEFSIDALTRTPLRLDGSQAAATALAFALRTNERVLPVLAGLPASDTSCMSEADAEALWQAYSQSTPEPAPLPRSRPPE